MTGVGPFLLQGTETPTCPSPRVFCLLGTWIGVLWRDCEACVTLLTIAHCCSSVGTSDTTRNNWRLFGHGGIWILEEFSTLVCSVNLEVSTDLRGYSQGKKSG